MAPVKTWGKHFFVPVTHFTKEKVRIVASQNDTKVTQTGGIIQSVPGGKESLDLDAREWVELEYLNNNGCSIEADKPVGVCSYIGVLDFARPSQCWVPALDQSVLHTRVAHLSPLTEYDLFNHKVLVCTPTDTKENTMITIGGAPPDALTDGSWIDNDSANMSFYTMPLTNDTVSYVFSNPNGLFVLCYGHSFYHNTTYYYLAGSAMRELDAAFYANDVHFQNLEKTPFCENLVTFRAELDNMGVEMDSIKWYVNGVKENLPHDQLVWSKTFNEVREYEIRMWARFNNDTVSKTGILKIENCNFSAAFYANNVHYENLSDTVFCNKTVNFITYIENLNTVQDSIKWYIYFGDSFEEYEAARNKKQWSRDFETGSYKIKMEALLANGETLPPLVATLKMEILWIKMRNVRY